MRTKLILFLLQVFCMFLFILLFRLSFLAYFYEANYKNSPEPLAPFLWIGSKFDLRLTLIIFLPLIPVYFMKFFSIGATKRVTLLYLGAVSLLLTFIYAFDFGHFAYLGLRLSASIFTFLQNFEISIQMLSESYNLLLYLLIVLLISFIYPLSIHFVHKIKISPENFSRKRYLIISKILIFLFIILGIFGQLSYYPLRWVQAFKTPNSKLSHLALNPVLFFFDTIRFASQSYDAEAIEKFLPKIKPLINDYFLTEDGNMGRRLKSNFKHLRKKPNIVVILLESLAAHKSSLFGNPLDSTPALDRMARESLHYARFYTSSTSTARSIFAFFTAMPDVSKVSTGTRNPLIVEQNILLNQMPSYKKFYFIGGDSSWGSIKGLLKNNIYGLQIYEQYDFESPRNDVWGVSDLNLFRESLGILEKESLDSKAPFFAFIQTAGFHRPYTIPKDRGNFELSFPSEKEIKRSGFHSQEEFNSLRFQDYAFGYFMKEAKKKSFYPNTIFIIFGDHGLPPQDPQHLNAWQKSALMTQYHVPLLIHCPSLFKPKKIHSITQQADLMPSVVDLAGYEAFSRTFGTSLFSKNRKNFAYSYAWSEPQEIMYIDEKYYIQKLPDHRGLLQLYNSGNPIKDHSKILKTNYEKLSKRLDALYELNRYLMYNNKRRQKFKSKT